MLVFTNEYTPIKEQEKEYQDEEKYFTVVAEKSMAFAHTLPSFQKLMH